MLKLIIKLDRKLVNEMSTMEKSSLKDELMLAIDNFIYPRLRKSEELTVVKETIIDRKESIKPIVKKTATKPRRQFVKTKREKPAKRGKENIEKCCDYCGGTFYTHKKNKKNCSDGCAYESNLRNIRKTNEAARLKKQKTSELKKSHETIAKIAKHIHIKDPTVDAKVTIIGRDGSKTETFPGRKTEISELNLSLIDELDTHFLGKERFCLRCGGYIYDSDEKSLYCKSLCVQQMKERISEATFNLRSPRISDVLYNGHKVRTYVSARSYLYVGLNESLVALMKKYKEEDL